MENNPDIFTLMQIIGGLFLLYLGIGMIRSEAKVIVQSEGKREGFFEGFFIAFLNPKIAVFMLAVLSSVLDPSMSNDTKWIIAGMGMTIDTVWYVIVALLLSKSTILAKIEQNQRSLNVATGVLMIGLAIWTALKLYHEF
jgi:threonine/homoserine/homoserine lactone efflux protein